MMINKKIFLMILLASLTSANKWDSDTPEMKKLEKLNTRSQLVRDLLTTNGTDVNLDSVCGKLAPRFASNSGGICFEKFTNGYGRNDERCDAFCCRRGYMTGYCKATSLNFASSIGGIFESPLTYGRVCTCTNERADVVCGPNETVMGISCPFDVYACGWTCCYQGKDDSRARCGRFLNLQCMCDE